MKLQRKRKTSEEEPNAVDNVESRARRTSRIVKKKRRLFEGSEALVVAAPSPAKKKALKQGDMQLELIRMVLKREGRRRTKTTRARRRIKRRTRRRRKKRRKRNCVTVKGS